jgi:hypothetical protein
MAELNNADVHNKDDDDVPAIGQNVAVNIDVDDEGITKLPVSAGNVKVTTEASVQAFHGVASNKPRACVVDQGCTHPCLRDRDLFATFTACSRSVTLAHDQGNAPHVVQDAITGYGDAILPTFDDNGNPVDIHITNAQYAAGMAHNLVPPRALHGPGGGTWLGYDESFVQRDAVTRVPLRDHRRLHWLDLRPTAKTGASIPGKDACDSARRDPPPARSGRSARRQTSAGVSFGVANATDSPAGCGDDAGAVHGSSAPSSTASDDNVARGAAPVDEPDARRCGGAPRTCGEAGRDGPALSAGRGASPSSSGSSRRSGGRVHPARHLGWFAIVCAAFMIDAAFIHAEGYQPSVLHAATGLGLAAGGAFSPAVDGGVKDLPQQPSGRPPNALDLWHQRLGHADVAQLQYQHICSTGIPKLPATNASALPCTSCATARGTRTAKHKTKAQTPIENPFDVVHSDVAGPFLRSYDG